MVLSEGPVQFFFADHTLDTDRRELRRGGELIAVQPQVFDIITYLLQNRQRVVSKGDLLTALWDGRNVADSTLATHINAARKAIGDSGDEQRLIRTVARKGLRFIGNVEMKSAAASAPSPATASQRPSTRAAERPGIAVLPFVNMSGDADQEYFSDGISEDIITALSKLRWFFVIARNSSFSYKGRAVHIREVANELGVSYVVEGSVRKEGERVRITAQLIDAASGSHLWAERYDRKLADVFAVQDEIAQAIVATIEPKLYSAEHIRAIRKPPENLDAWDLVMRALWHYWRVTREDNRNAQELLEKAIAIDPDYAQAHAVLAVSHTFGAHMGWEDAATVTPIAARAAHAAVRADHEDPWAHLALACAHVYRGRIEDALASFENALRLNPNFALAQAYYGLVQSWTGRWREGAEAIRRAIRMSPRDPLSAIYDGIAAHIAFVGGEFAEAIALSRKSIRQRSDFVGAWRVLTASAGMAGEIEVAREALGQLRRLQPDISHWLANLPYNGEEHDRFVEGMRRAGLE
jgi:TolB-like protein/Tfp pilus assembly protein PilF